MSGHNHAECPECKFEAALVVVRDYLGPRSSGSLVSTYPVAMDKEPETCDLTYALFRAADRFLESVGKPIKEASP